MKSRENISISFSGMRKGILEVWRILSVDRCSKICVHCFYHQLSVVNAVFLKCSCNSITYHLSLLPSSAGLSDLWLLNGLSLQQYPMNLIKIIFCKQGNSGRDEIIWHTRVLEKNQDVKHKCFIMPSLMRSVVFIRLGRKDWLRVFFIMFKSKELFFSSYCWFRDKCMVWEWVSSQ